MNDRGEIIFTTIDTKATSNIRWETVGFTIRRDKTNGNPLKDSNYAVLYLSSGEKTTKNLANGNVEIQFKFSNDKVIEALKNCNNMENLQNKDRKSVV